MAASIHKHKYEIPAGYDGVAIYDACECGAWKAIAGSCTVYSNGNQATSSQKDHDKYLRVMACNPIRTR